MTPCGVFNHANFTYRPQSWLIQYGIPTSLILWRASSTYDMTAQLHEPGYVDRDRHAWLLVSVLPGNASLTWWWQRFLGQRVLIGAALLSQRGVNILLKKATHNPSFKFKFKFKKVLFKKYEQTWTSAEWRLKLSRVCMSHYLYSILHHTMISIVSCDTIG